MINTVDNPLSIDSALDSAARAFAEWATLPLDDRMAQVKAALRYFVKDRDVIARDITLQMGKPITQSQQEIDTFLARAEYLLSIAKDALADDVLPDESGAHKSISHVPHGVVFVMSAWNYPLLIPVNVVVPALLAGNVVVLKHSAKTPLCGVHLEKAFASLSVPSVLSNLTLSHQEAIAVAQDPRVDFVAFTGSVEGGRAINAACAARFIDTNFELGGKDAAYVAEDADLESAVDAIVDGACYNAGQSCCGIERVYVHQKHYEAFVQQADALMRAYVLGDPLDKNTTMGPLATASALTTIEQQLQDAVKKGATMVCGGSRAKNLTGHFFEPTLLTDVTHDMLIMQAETFGPVLPVMCVTDDAEALRFMNDSEFGLTASVWTASRERAAWFCDRLAVGTVFANRCDYLDPALAWTGVRNSGKGVSLSGYGFLQLTRRKSFLCRTSSFGQS